MDAVAPFVVAVKPQVAFYERYGWEGLRIFTQTIQYARERGLLVIADAKRNDIGSTAVAYADAFLGEASLGDDMAVPVFDVDALTVNPYLGADGVIPFIEAAKRYGKGVFVLVRTSNPSARDLQDLETPAGSLYQAVGRLVDRWGEETEGQEGYRFIGAVVGATYPEELRQIRQSHPDMPILIPGVGAQGGDLASAVRYGVDAQGERAIINSSRQIIYASREKDFAQAARRAATELREQINSYRSVQAS